MFPDMCTLQHKSKRLKLLKTTSASLSRCAQRVPACIAHPCLSLRVSADGTLLMQKTNPVGSCTQSIASVVRFQSNLWSLCAAGPQAMDEIHFGQGIHCCWWLQSDGEWWGSVTWHLCGVALVNPEVLMCCCLNAYRSVKLVRTGLQYIWYQRPSEWLSWGTSRRATLSIWRLKLRHRWHICACVSQLCVLCKHCASSIMMILLI